ncbi:response regulator [Aurantiacibacter xanthus]|uniref:Response regulator n=1 Tax=Aurantiacibacter xanthus TaxID=1784712 RepID=A0A3A1P105_9SPHN|nr:response regulator [Aurantiacibacter xanthus]RIV81144.1 response regulator [Aurantiacibacter xanthus]
MTKRVLVVEDDLLNRMFLSDSLRLHGYDVCEVDDGARVMDAVRDYAPDLVTMDINIPHISGETLIRRLRRDAAYATMPVLAITAFASPKDEQRIRQLGADGFMAKPLALRSLLEAVGELIGASESRPSPALAAA